MSPETHDNKNDEMSKALPPPPPIWFILADTVSVSAPFGHRASLHQRLVSLPIGMTIFNLDVGSRIGAWVVTTEAVFHVGSDTGTLGEMPGCGL